MTNSTQVKCFIGFLLTSEIKMYLHQNSEWKEASLFQNQFFTEVTFLEKEYLGIFVEPPLSYSDIKAKENILREHLKLYCPNVRTDKNKIYLFPQLFLA